MANGNDHYDAWTERIKALTPTIDKVLPYLLQIAIILLQIHNGIKIDRVAVTSLDTDATTQKWRAEHTGDPKDERKAAAAAEKLEKIP